MSLSIAPLKTYDKSFEVTTKAKLLPFNRCILVCTLLLIGCVLSLASAQSVETSKDVYNPGELIQIIYRGFASNCEECDWVTLVKEGERTDGYDSKRWHWTTGSSGTMDFEGLPDGRYEVRGYEQWDVLRYEGLVARYSFTVENTRTISLELELGSSGESVFVYYSGLPGDVADWITVVPVGTADNSYGKYFYSEGKEEDLMHFTGLTSGNYEARVYFGVGSDTYLVRYRQAFTIP